MADFYRQQLDHLPRYILAHCRCSDAALGANARVELGGQALRTVIDPGHGDQAIDSRQRKAQAGRIDKDAIFHFVSCAADHSLGPGDDSRLNRQQGLMELRLRANAAGERR